MALYNEINPIEAKAIELLIELKEIAPGLVDRRDVRDISPIEFAGYDQVHLFAGSGAWSYAFRLAGWPDNEPVWSISCPCQPFSAAGGGGGFADERHLWPYADYLIQECRPQRIFGEQVASKNGLAWLDLVQDDLEGKGYTFGAVDTCAAGFGAPHIRQRIYWVAYAERDEQPRKKSCSGEAGRMGRIIQPFSWDTPWQSALSNFRVLDDGNPRCVAATDAARNAIVAPQAAAFVKAFMEYAAIDIGYWEAAE